MPHLGTVPGRPDRDPVRMAGILQQLVLNPFVQAEQVRRQEATRSALLSALASGGSPQSLAAALSQQPAQPQGLAAILGGSDPHALGGSSGLRDAAIGMLMKNAMTPQRDTQYGAAPWHQNPRYAETPAARAAAGAPRLNRLRRELAALRKSHRSLILEKAETDAGEQPDLVERLGTELDKLDAREDEILQAIEAIEGGPTRRGQESPRARKRVRSKVAAQPAAATPTQPPTQLGATEIPEGTIIVSETTGERRILQNGQWVPFE